MACINLRMNTFMYVFMVCMVYSVWVVWGVGVRCQEKTQWVPMYTFAASLCNIVTFCTVPKCDRGPHYIEINRVLVPWPKMLHASCVTGKVTACLSPKNTAQAPLSGNGTIQGNPHSGEDWYRANRTLVHCVN